jgi:ADP-heptose:LPS heptosyltransferase
VRILLVRLRPLGDVVFTTPLLGALRRHLPDAHLTYLIEPEAAPILESNADIDDLAIVPRSRGVSRVRDDLRIARRLARARFDVAVDLHGGPRSAWFTWASRAPMRIGYTIAGRTWVYTHPVTRARELTPRHSVLNQWDLLAPLGIPHGSPAADPVRMGVNAAADDRIANTLHDVGVGPAHRLIVIHVSASNRFKRWPEESFVSLVVDLIRQDGSRRVFLTSGPSDTDGARRIASAARRQLGGLSSALLDLGSLGSLDIPELRALVTRAAVYIGGDSGPLHVAATTETPIVELLGPTLAERSHPWRDPRWFTEVLDAGPLPCRPCHQRVCAPGDFRCLTLIGPDRVRAAAERALQACTGSPAHGASNESRERRIPAHAAASPDA